MTSIGKAAMAINLKFDNALLASRLMAWGCGSEGSDGARWWGGNTHYHAAYHTIRNRTA